MSETNILLLGAGGQVGVELTKRLREIYGNDHVIASDIKQETETDLDGRYLMLNVLDGKLLSDIIQEYKITQVYHLAALLSATAEKNPMFGWELNMQSLLNVLNIAKDQKLERVYWPSSIAAFGVNTPRHNTPQNCIMDPNTVYGISKLAGERWCEYYFQKYGVDTRSIRYPGLISWAAEPGGGATDYAIHIFHQAILHGKYECFLSADTELPMLYMPDAINATVNIMTTEAVNIKQRGSYNLAGFSVTPAQLAVEIKKHIPEFEITYKPDFRQGIADSWPASIDDSDARKDWNWNHEYDLTKMVTDMLHHLKIKLNSNH